MIIVDTNVLSQPIRDDGEQRVIDWLDLNDSEISIPAQSVAELVYGYEILPAGRRRTDLEEAVFSLLTRYRGRVIAFDRSAAEAHGWLTAKLRREGNTMPFTDTQVAAIAISRSAPVATRNVKHFAATGVALINPWDY